MITVSFANFFLQERWPLSVKAFSVSWKSIKTWSATSYLWIIQSIWWLQWHGTLPLGGTLLLHESRLSNYKIIVGYIIRPNSVAVYSCTTGHRNPVTWGLLQRWAMDSWLKYPTKDMMWYPSAYFTINMFSLKLSEALFHHIPAYLFDMFYAVTGKRTRWVSKRLDHRIIWTQLDMVKSFRILNRFGCTPKPIEHFLVWNFSRRINGDSSVTTQSACLTRCQPKTGKHSILMFATLNGKAILKLSFWALDVLFSKMIPAHYHWLETTSTGIELNKKTSETLQCNHSRLLLNQFQAVHGATSCKIVDFYLFTACCQKRAKICWCTSAV